AAHAAGVHVACHAAGMGDGGGGHECDAESGDGADGCLEIAFHGLVLQVVGKCMHQTTWHPRACVTAPSICIAILQAPRLTAGVAICLDGKGLRDAPSLP